LQGGVLRRFNVAVVVLGLLMSCVVVNAGPAFFPKEFSGLISMQSLPVGQCTLQTFNFADTTTSGDAGYIPLTVSVGMDLAILFGYIHLNPKVIFETSVGGDGEGFWGMGGALALEAHPLRAARNDPYLYCNFGYINMPGGGYDGQGYHIDVGTGFIYSMSRTVKIAPFIAYTPVNQWMRKREVGYILVDPIIGPEPAYEGRLCRHSGLRLGISVLFNIFEAR
jgi:hypothetical protein